MKETHRLRQRQKQKIQAREIFAILLYMQEMIGRGTYKDDDFNEIIKRNMSEHGHGRFHLPDTWKEDLPVLINKYGWRIFKASKAEKEPQKREGPDGH
jgi:hypothetical protein